MPLVLQGATSGQATINPTDAATVTLTLPATTGTLAVSGGSPSFSTLTVTGDASISGLTVGKGGGAVSTNTAVGASALAANTSGLANTAMGAAVMSSNTTGGYNSAYGRNALGTNTTGSNNTALGYNSLVLGTTGGKNTAIGDSALFNNTTADNNTAVGYQAGYSTTTGTEETFIGTQAGYSVTTGVSNTFVGRQAGYSVTTGAANTFIGGGWSGNNLASGYYVTTGSRNSILGNYNGNQGGLDIRTSSNYIVLSDGDGNPRGYFDGSGNLIVGSTVSDVIGSGANGLSYRPSIGNLSVLAASGGALSIGRATTTGTMVFFYYNASQKGSISTDGTNTAYNTSSDYRLKENIVNAPSAFTKIDAIQIRSFDWKETGTHQQYGVVAQELEKVAPEAITKGETEEDMWGVDYSKLVPSLIKCVQELKATVDAQAARIAVLEGK